MSEELKPCPFCGKKPKMCSFDRVAAVICSSEKCHAEGPIKDTEIKARNAWNLRSEPAGKETHEAAQKKQHKEMK